MTDSMNYLGPALAVSVCGGYEQRLLLFFLSELAICKNCSVTNADEKYKHIWFIKS